MSDIFKCYIFIGMFIAITTKFPLYSWENFLIGLSFVLIMSVFRRSVEHEQHRESLEHWYKQLVMMGYHEEAEKIKTLIPPRKKSFIERIKEDIEKMEDDNERF